MKGCFFGHPNKIRLIQERTREQTAAGCSTEKQRDKDDKDDKEPVKKHLEDDGEKKYRERWNTDTDKKSLTGAAGNTEVFIQNSVTPGTEAAHYLQRHRVIC